MGKWAELLKSEPVESSPTESPTEPGRWSQLLADSAPPTPIAPEPRKMSDTAMGFMELAGSMMSKEAGKAVGGLAGIASMHPLSQINQAMTDGAPSTPGDIVRSTQEAISVEPGPRGQELGQDIGAAISGVIPELVKEGGRWVANKYGELQDASTEYGPGAETLIKTLPTVAEYGAGFGIGKAATTASKIAHAGKVNRAIKKSAPGADAIKETASSMFKEIDDLGVTIKPDAYQKMVTELEDILIKKGIDHQSTPAAFRALERLKEGIGQPQALSHMDTMREVARSAAGSTTNMHESMLGSRIIGKIDDFLDTAGPDSFSAGNAKELGSKYKLARDLWGRRRRSELIETAFEDARNQATGLENGVRIQFRALLKNKKTKKLFKDEELKAMQHVVRGGKIENVLKLMGRFGFSEGGATNMLGGSIGAGAGFAVGGVAGAIAIPLIGQISRKLAQRLTGNNAKFADAVIRAGKNAKEITSAYIKNTPKHKQSSSELSELLMKADMSRIPSGDLVKEAAALVRQRQGAAAIAGGSVASAGQDKKEQD